MIIPFEKCSFITKKNITENNSNENQCFTKTIDVAPKLNQLLPTILNYFFTSKIIQITKLIHSNNLKRDIEVELGKEKEKIIL